MSGRLDGRVAVVIGGGQTPGETIGNGRATAITFAREGAKVVVVDRELASAEETVAMIRDAGGEAIAARCRHHRSRVVRVDPGGGRRRHTARSTSCTTTSASAPATRPAVHVDEDAWQRIFDVNLSAMWRTCKAVIPVMREAGHGAIVNISSIASICSTQHRRLPDLQGRA